MSSGSRKRGLDGKLKLSESETVIIPPLPWDIWKGILLEVLGCYTKERLSMSLVCKDWKKFYDEHDYTRFQTFLQRKDIVVIPQYPGVTRSYCIAFVYLLLHCSKKGIIDSCIMQGSKGLVLSKGKISCRRKVDGKHCFRAIPGTESGGKHAPDHVIDLCVPSPKPKTLVPPLCWTAKRVWLDFNVSKMWEIIHAANSGEPFAQWLWHNVQPGKDDQRVLPEDGLRHGTPHALSCLGAESVRDLQSRPEMVPVLYEIFKDLRKGLKKLW